MHKQSKEIAEELKTFSDEELLENFYNSALRLGYPIACWKLPDSSDKHVVIEFSPSLQPQKIQLDPSFSGFAVSPFVNHENGNTLFIRADVYYNFSSKKLSLQNAYAKEESQMKFWDHLFATPQEKGGEKLQEVHHSTGQNDYKNNVQKAIQAIQEGSFKKVVLARQKQVPLPVHFNPVKTFLRLCEEQSSSFVSLIYIPGSGCWIGASPELLVSISNEKIFKTTSLAGTQPFVDGAEMCNAVWTQKEIEEQALVSRYIISCFKTIRLREYEEDGPKTVKAGNLIHLKTDFLVNMNEVNFPELGTQMLDLLHPTSAVCGMPKAPALEFIQKHENNDRKFYSGFTGPVNIEDESHVYVNIRCAEIGRQNAILYSGAGITAGSDPEKEFRETELKMKLMEDLFNSQF